MNIEAALTIAQTVITNVEAALTIAQAVVRGQAMTASAREDLGMS